MLPLFLSMIDSHENQSKFEQIYHAYNNLLFHVSLDILHDECLAEDTVQRAFLKLIPQLSKLGDAACHQTKNFLVIMVRNLAFDLYSERKKIPQVPYEDLGEDELAVDETSLLERMEFQALVEKIRALPEIYGGALYLMYCEDCSVKKIASITGVSVSAAKKRLERGRQLLRAKLLEEEADET
jgi:RNA polymerase sigma-70 factor (ECF subfamily)